MAHENILSGHRGEVDPGLDREVVRAEIPRVVIGHFHDGGAPLKVNAWPTLPAAKPAPLSALPLMPPTTSVASFSAGNHAIKFVGAARQMAALTVRLKFCTSSLPTPLLAVKVMG